jgi:hypothetical protein
MCWLMARPHGTNNGSDIPFDVMAIQTSSCFLKLLDWSVFYDASSAMNIADVELTFLVMLL